MVESLVWLPSFETGMHEIDDEHRNLFALARAMPEELARGSSAAVVPFIAASERHFAHEEAILLDVGYPGLTEHKKYHSDLLQRARRLKMLCDAEGNSPKANKCYEEVVAFLIDDILRGDISFKSYLQYHADIAQKRH